MALYRDHGVVLRTSKLGETDRIITFLTRENGKVRAVAKGVRRPGSKFGARLEPTNNVALQLYRGRNLDIVTQAETLDTNRSLREDYALLTHAISMLEAVDQVAQERESDPVMYRMLEGALRTLSSEKSPIVSVAFLWKLLSHEGFHPVLTSCARCELEFGDAVEPATFDFGEGGALCSSCAAGGGRRISADAIVVISALVDARVRAVIDQPPSTEVLLEVEHLGVGALEHHSERRLRSAALY